MTKRTAILILLGAIIAVFIGGCYTQIKLTKPTEKTHRNWEKDCSRRYHDPCRWCSGWHYYYNYPWWLDQIWWWEKYSDEPEPELERRRERFERRRGFGTAVDAIIEGFERIGDDEDTDTDDSGDEDEENPENNDDEREDRPERRRGL